MYSKKEDLVTLAKQSKKLPNFIWATILAFLFMTGGQIIGGICIIPLYIILSFFHSISSNLKILELFIQLSSFVFISILVFVRVKYIEKRSISTLGFSKDSWLKKYIKGFVIGLVMMIIVVLMLCLFGCVSVEKNPSQPIGISAIGGVIIILIGWIIQGGTEEIVTRGWLMNVLGARYNIMVGLILSSVFFALIHSENPGINYVAMLNIVLVGILLGLIVINTGSLWVACGIHSAWNFAQGNIFGFQVSGNDVGIGSIVDLNLVGNEFITGGQFGPEAGMVCSFVILALIVIMLFLTKRDSLKNIR